MENPCVISRIEENSEREMEQSSKHLARKTKGELTERSNRGVKS